MHIQTQNTRTKSTLQTIIYTLETIDTHSLKLTMTHTHTHTHYRHNSIDILVETNHDKHIKINTTNIIIYTLINISTCIIERNYDTNIIHTYTRIHTT